jgi:hypothetical protein
MPLTDLLVGTTANDGTGETLRSGGQKINTNYTFTVTTDTTQTVSGTKTFTADVFLSDKIVHNGNTNTAIRFPANNTVAIETDGSERLRVDSSGNVGIGTTSPATLLHVNGFLRHGEQTQAVVSVAFGTRVDTRYRTAVTSGGSGIMQSMFGDVPTVGEFYAYELGTTHYLLGVFYKTGSGSAAVVTVLASSVLTLGASNAGGTQNINNATDNDNVRMIALIRRVG